MPNATFSGIRRPDTNICYKFSLGSHPVDIHFITIHKTEIPDDTRKNISKIRKNTEIQGIQAGCLQTEAETCS